MGYLFSYENENSPLSVKEFYNESYIFIYHMEL